MDDGVSATDLLGDDSDSDNYAMGLPDTVDTGDGSSSILSSLGISSSSTTTYALLAFAAVAAIVLLKKL